MGYLLNNILEVRNVCRTAGDGSVNVRHYRVSVVNGTGPEGATLAGEMALVFRPAYLAIMSIEARWEELTVQKIWPLPVEGRFTSQLAPTAGTSLNDMLPRQVCGLVTLQTALPGPAGRGRQYLPFPPEDFNSEIGQPTAAYLTATLAMRTALIQSFVTGAPADGGTIVPVLWHRVTSTFTSLAQVVIRSRWGTQRRRNNNRF